MQESWEPECTPEEAEINLKESIYSEQDSLNRTGQARDPQLTPGGDEEDPRDPEDGDPPQDIQVSKYSKEIGDWGERCAKKFLEKEYRDIGTVHWLNIGSQVGIGCDFVIKDEQGYEIAYYEVKAKTIEEPELIKIEKAQWQWATKLHDQGRGDHYYLLVISKTGNRNPDCEVHKDPVKLWKEGKLKVQPIYLEL